MPKSNLFLMSWGVLLFSCTYKQKKVNASSSHKSFISTDGGDYESALIESRIKGKAKIIASQSANVPTAKIYTNKSTHTDSIWIPKGVLYQFNFPDSSEVYVNSGSSLVQRQIGDSVYKGFQGEAIYITKQYPISINAGNGLQVLADSNSRFVIANYSDFAEEPLLKLGLLKGQVWVVGETTTPVFPGQQVQYDRKFPVTARAKLDSAKSLAWAHQKFYFDDVDAYGIFEKISRWYNVSIDFPRSAVTNYHFHLVANFSEPLEKILATINGTLVHEAFILKDNKIKLEKM